MGPLADGNGPGRLVEGYGLFPSLDLGPHGQKHDGHRPDGLTFQTDDAVLPVAEALFQVNIFVRQIHTAGKADLSVHNEEFPVVPVVEPGRQYGDIGVEGTGFDAHLLQFTPISAGQRHNTAEIVIDDPDIYTGSGLFPQKPEHLFPQPPGLDDKILQENIPLGPGDGVQHIPHRRLAAGIVGALGVLADGAPGHTNQVIGLQSRVGAQRLLPLQHPHILGQVVHMDLLHRLHPPFQPPGQPVAAEEQIKGDAEEGQSQNGNNPGDFIGGFRAARHNPDDGQPGHNVHADIKPDRVARQVVYAKHQHAHLNQQAQGHDHRPLKQQLEITLHGAPPFP